MPSRPTSLVPLPSERIVSRIFAIRGRNVMLDRDLAELYGVPTKVLNQAVRRNIKRFPADFMFRLTRTETDLWRETLRSQNVTLNSGRGSNVKYPPSAFTEQGVAMLSSVLNSERAIRVNIEIIRTFTRLREMLATHADLRRKIEAMEKKYDKRFRVVFDALRELLDGGQEPKREIGFH